METKTNKHGYNLFFFFVEENFTALRVKIKMIPIYVSLSWWGKTRRVTVHGDERG